MNLSDKIALFSAIGGWVSGLGALAAVITSLYIANKKVKVQLKCTVSEKIIFTHGAIGPGIEEKGIAFEIVNLTTIPITLTSLGWRFDKKFYFHQILGDHLSHSLPKRIEYGEKALFWVKLEGREDAWFNAYAEALKLNGVIAKHVECGISTTTGGVKYFPVDSSLKERFKKIVS